MPWDVAACILAAFATFLAIAAPHAARSRRAGARFAFALLIALGANAAIAGIEPSRAVEFLALATGGGLLVALHRWAATLHRRTPRGRRGRATGRDRSDNR
jgi:hypothetical protein